MEAVIRTPYWRASSSRRSWRGSLPMIWRGPTSLPRSSPAMMDSAMTPEPIVATVRFESGDMRPSIGRDWAEECRSRANCGGHAADLASEAGIFAPDRREPVAEGGKRPAVCSRLPLGRREELSGILGRPS